MRRRGRLRSSPDTLIDLERSTVGSGVAVFSVRRFHPLHALSRAPPRQSLLQEFWQLAPAIKGASGRPRQRSEEACRGQVRAAELVTNEVPPSGKLILEPIEFRREFLLQCGHQSGPGVHAGRHQASCHGPHQAPEASLPGRNSVEQKVPDTQAWHAKRLGIDELPHQDTYPRLEALFQGGRATADASPIQNRATALYCFVPRAQDRQRRPVGNPLRTRNMQADRPPFLLIVQTHMVERPSGPFAIMRRREDIEPSLFDHGTPPNAPLLH